MFHNSDVGQYMPKPADIIRYLEGNSETKALGAWSKVESAIRHVGIYENVTFDDPLIHVVINQMGGWSLLCSIKSENISFRANEFIKRYRHLLRKNLINYAKTLSGLFDISNTANGFGYFKSLAVLVGDKSRAEEVLKKGDNMNIVAIHRNYHEPSKIKFLSDNPLDINNQFTDKAD